MCRATSIGRFLALAVATVLACSIANPAVASAANDQQPNSQTQPLADGCQRNPTGLLSDTSPEWVYVYKDPKPREVEGTLTHTHTAGGDLPESHDWYDLNSNVNVLPQYTYLLSTANFSDPGAEDYGRLHVEWETGSVPTYVWPTEGDQVQLWGSWVWDCGHWGTSFSTSNPDYLLPGQGETNCSGCPGEATEFHPMHAMIVTRANPYRPASTESEADVYISTDGTQAHAEAQCALENPPSNIYTYPPGFTACLADPSQRYQRVNDRNYTFFLAAPPRPSPTATLQWRTEDPGVSVNAPGETVQVLSNGIQVTIPFKNFGKPGERQVYGKRFFVGWNEDPTPPTDLKVHFNQLTVFHSLDPPTTVHLGTDDPGGEWNLYLDANGYWQLLNDWAPGLGFLSDGETLPLGQTAELHVQSGHGVRIYLHGRECDLPKIKPCPANPGEVADDNDLPGEILDQFPSAAAAIGTHVSSADSGDYQVSYTVTYGP